MKVEFLADIEKIFEFLLRETSPENMISIIYEEIKELTESFVLQRDIENYIAYFKVILSAPRIPRKMKFDSSLVRAFINRTYTGLADSALEYHSSQLYNYLEGNIGRGVDITNECLDNLALELEVMKTPTLQKIMARTRVATILKWLQGHLKERLSLELQDNVIFLATVYGQYKKNLAINVDWLPYDVIPEDIDVLVSEYRVLEIAIIEALETIRHARRANPDLSRYEEQFQIVLTSLDNLGKLEEAGNLDSFDSLKDRLIISTVLIYIQDDFVQKDAELKQLIQLFVSLYFKYRDKHHEAERNTGLSNREN
jgi:hypothetical protein